MSWFLFTVAFGWFFLTLSKNHTFNLDTFRAYLFRLNMFVLEPTSHTIFFFIIFFQSFRNLYSISLVFEHASAHTARHSLKWSINIFIHLFFRSLENNKCVMCYIVLDSRLWCCRTFLCECEMWMVLFYLIENKMRTWLLCSYVHMLRRA